ncbi:hypothetical protein NE237_014565 [Protea cynaroides]|uniref:Uncharacterized protein n=1 Tax=Protea cynaroides TaxID=273540 RepID=A0A9Q0KCE4_9MAGN|nr:hypothetical protein NE237_014565 [Protea cynaroides]
MSSLPLPHLPVLLLGLLAFTTTLSDASHRSAAEEKLSFTVTEEPSLMVKQQPLKHKEPMPTETLQHLPSFEALPHHGHHRPGHPPEQGLLSSDPTQISTTQVLSTSHFFKPSLPVFKPPILEKPLPIHFPLPAKMRPITGWKPLPATHYKKPWTFLHRPLYKFKPPSATIHHL